MGDTVSNNFNLSQLADKANVQGNLNDASIGITTPAAGSFTTLNANSATIGTTTTNGGTINNTSIGATTPSTGAFTTLSSTSGNLNGTVGATTPSTGAFTTLSASGAATLPTIASNSVFNTTGAITLPSGTDVQRPSPTLGMIRYNSLVNEFEGYSQVASISGWYSVGGSSIVNDTSASTAFYPLYAKATSGTAQVIYTANTSYTYKPSTGELTAPAPIASNGLLMNSSTVSSSYTVTAGNNASSTGPITVNNGVVVTISSGSRWVIQ